MSDQFSHRFWIKRNLLLLFLLLMAFSGFSQPINDDCINAVELTIIAPGYADLDTGSTNGSVPEIPQGSASISGKGVWYKFTGVAGATMIVSSVGYNFDQAMQLYSGTTCGSFTLVGSVVNANSSVTNSIESYSFTAQEITYYVYVAAPSSSTSTGNFSISVAVQRPVNDDCANAITLSCSNPSVVGTTVGTLLETTHPTGSNYTDYGVWYKVTAVANSSITAICPTGNVFLIGMTVYTGTCGSLTPITPTANFVANSTTGIASTILSANTYYIYIGASPLTISGNPNTSTGDFSISYVPNSSTATSPPCNDICSNAFDLPCGQEISGTTFGAVNEKGVLGASSYYIFSGITTNSNQITLPSLTGITTNPKMYVSVSSGAGVFPLGTFVSSSSSNPIGLNSSPTTPLSSAEIILSTFPNTGVWYKFKGNGQQTSINVTPVSGFVPYVYIFSSSTIETSCSNTGSFTTNSGNIVASVTPISSTTSSQIFTSSFTTICDQTYLVYVGSSSNTVFKGDFRIKRSSSVSSLTITPPAVSSYCETATANLNLNVNPSNVAQNSCGYKPLGTWSPSTVNTSIAGTFSYVFTPNPGQCVNTTPILTTITIDPSPTPLVLNGSTVCAPSTSGTITSTTSETNINYQLYMINPSNPNGIYTNTMVPGTGSALSFSVTPDKVSPVDTLYFVQAVSALVATSCPGISNTVTVVRNPIPVIANKPYTICSGAAFTFATVGTDVVPAGTTYTWSISTNTNLSGQSAQSVAQTSISQTLTSSSSINQTLTYTVTPSSGSCVGSSFSITVTVKPKPTINSSTLTSCSGSVFNATPTNTSPTIAPTGTTYTWPLPGISPASSVTLASAQNNVSSISQTLTLASASISGIVTYQVTPTANGCTGSVFSVAVTVNPIPVVAAKTYTICSGNAFTYASVAGDVVPSGTTYTWTISTPNTNLSGQSTQSVAQTGISQTLTNITSVDQQLIYTVTPSVGTCNGTPFTITVNVKPRPNIQNTTPIICSGTLFTVAPVDGTPNIVPTGTTYTWTAPTLNPPSSITGAGSAQTTAANSITKTLTNVTSSDATATYQVTASSGTSPTICTSTFQIQVTVNPKPTIANKTPSICSGNTFSITPTGTDIIPTGTTYTWIISTNNTNISGQSDQTTPQSTIGQLLTNSTNVNQNLTYQVTPTSGSCVGSSFNVTVTVRPTPYIQDFTAPTICSSNTANLLVTPSGSSPNIIPTGTKYTWSLPTINPLASISGVTAQSTLQSNISQILTNTTSLVATATYTVTATSGTSPNTCTSSFTLTVNVNPKPSIQTIPQTICSGSAFSVSPVDGLPNIVPAGTNYTWTAPSISPNGSVTGASSQNSPQSVISQTLTNNTASNATATYTVTASPGSVPNCTATFQVVITVTPKTTVTFTPVGPYCSGSTITALPTSSTNTPAITGTWSPPINNTATTTYTFTPTVGQCATTTQMTITITPNVTPTFTSVGPYCSGATITALPTSSTNTPAITGTWSPPINNTATTTYTFTPTVGQCATTSQMTITITPNVTPTFTSVGPYCSGATITALPTSSNNTPAINGTWSPPINNTATTTYTFTPTVGQCATTSQTTITITPNVTPTFTQVGPYCSGSSIPLLPTSSSDPSPVDGTWSPAIDNTTTTIYTFTPSAGQCANSTTMEIVILPNASINNITGTFTLNVNQTTTLTANNIVLGGGNGVWSSDDATVATVNSTTGLVTAVSPGICVITYAISGGCGTATVSETITVNSNLVPIDASATQPTCALLTGTITTISPLPLAGITYILEGTNPIIAPQNNTSGIFSSLAAGDYEIKYTQNGDTSASLILTIDSPPIIPSVVPEVSVTQPNCSVSTGNISITAPLPAAGITFTLTKTNLPTSTQTNATGTFNNLNPGNYSLTYTENNSCSSEADTFTIYTFSGTPTVTIDDTSICSGQSVTLSAVVTPTGGTFLWSNAQTSPTINVSPSSTTNYQVFYSVVGCPTVQGSGTVTVKPIPTVTVNNLTICEGTSTTLSANCSPGGGTYLWTSGNETTPTINVSPASTTTYELDYTLNGCSNSGTGTVTVNTSVAANVTISNSDPDNTICEGDLVTFTATPINGGTAPTFQWFINGNSVSGQTNATFSPTTLNDQDVVTVEMTSNELCVSNPATTSLPLTISIIPYPNPIISSDVQSGCSPLTVQLSNTGTLANSCVWTIDNNLNFTGCSSQYTFTEAGCYDITLSTNVNGCTGQTTATDYICVIESPVANFKPNPTEFTDDIETVTFNNYSTNATAYLWDFGDGITSTVETPTHEFSNTIDGYLITLTATSSSGCQDVDTFKMIRKQELVYYIPNSFSPNGDEFNQTFKPIFTTGFDPNNYSFYVYNRFGNLIFESHDPNMGWDGSYKEGNAIYNCQIGTYVWSIEYSLYDSGSKTRLSGSVNLLH